jgi:hypothetical protein
MMAAPGVSKKTSLEALSMSQLGQLPLRHLAEKAAVKPLKAAAPVVRRWNR